MDDASETAQVLGLLWYGTWACYGMGQYHTTTPARRDSVAMLLPPRLEGRNPGIPGLTGSCPEAGGMDDDPAFLPFFSVLPLLRLACMRVVPRTALGLELPLGKEGEEVLA